VRQRRTYDQYCALARGLEVVGERWTLLVIRELVLGPKRYTDLLDGLPGIGTNLLAQRLRELESSGVVLRRRLPRPAASTVYELTELGRGLEDVVVALGRWGAAFLGEPRAKDASRAGWYVLSMLATFRPELAAQLDETFELRVDDDVFEILVASGKVAAEQVPAARSPDSTLALDVEGLVGLLAGSLPVPEAIETKRVRVEGRAGALERFVELFRWPELENSREGALPGT